MMVEQRLRVHLVYILLRYINLILYKMEEINLIWTKSLVQEPMFCLWHIIVLSLNIFLKDSAIVTK